MKKALILETSSPLGGLALIEFSNSFSSPKNVCSREWRQLASHSEIVTPSIDSALKETGWLLDNIDYFATGIGPGSFTGIRVSLNVIRSFAYITNKPVHSFNSLYALALSTDRRQGLPIVTLINAHKNMMYGAKYIWNKDRKLKELIPPSSWTLVKLPELITKPCLCVGNGFPTYRSQIPQNLADQLIRDKSQPDEPLVSIFGTRLFSDLGPENFQGWKTTKALYIRASEAEEQLRKNLLKPLAKI